MPPNATLLLTVKVEGWVAVEDVSIEMDGSALKRVLAKGQGWERPQDRCHAPPPPPPSLHRHLRRHLRRHLQLQLHRHLRRHLHLYLHLPYSPPSPSSPLAPPPKV